MQALKPSAIREIFKALTDPTIISLAAGNPSPESFPVEDLARISSEIFSDSSTAALQYSVTEGELALGLDVISSVSEQLRFVHRDDQRARGARETGQIRARSEKVAHVLRHMVVVGRDEKMVNPARLHFGAQK